MSVLLKIDPGQPDENVLAEAVGILKRGGIVAYPTETFYGLGADASSKAAVGKIFRIKGRNFRHPIAVIVDDEREAIPLAAEIPETGRILMQKFWPGPLTLLFRAAPSVPLSLTAGTGKIGVRVSSHPLARRLARGVGGPLTATSANLSGGPECVSAGEVVRALGKRVDAVIDAGATPGGLGSTILDVTAFPPLILREGAVPATLILSALGLAAG